MYCSEEAHSSVDKSAIAIGLGIDSLRRIAVDESFAMRPDLLEDGDRGRSSGRCRAGCRRRHRGDDVHDERRSRAAIADICEREHLWLHVDAAYGGVAAMLPSHAHILSGSEKADSLVINPHKWLFTPFDLSAFYCRRMDVIRRAFSVTPDYCEPPKALRLAISWIPESSWVGGFAPSSCGWSFGPSARVKSAATITSHRTRQTICRLG